MRTLAVFIVIMFALLLSGAALMAEDAQPPASPGKIDALKPLLGKWEVTENEGMKGTIEFRLTAAGSAVMEMMFPGSPHEMVNMYVMDGDNLMVTHYCSMGNQPRMKLGGDDKKALKFEFVDAMNLPGPKSPHMHSFTVNIKDADHISEEWTLYDAGKEAERKVFELTRIK